MPFWLLQTHVILWKKHLERLQDWALQTEVCRQGTAHFTLHDQCLSDDRHFKIGQITPLANPYFLNKPSARLFSLLLTPVFPEHVFCCFLPHLVTSSGSENESWYLSCELLIRREGGVRTAEQASAMRTLWTGITGHRPCFVLNPLCHCSTHSCWAQSNDRGCTNHSYNQNSSYSLGRVGWRLGL